MNYVIWAKFVSLFLCEKGKLGYMNGKILRLEATDPSFSDWEVNDRMFWLLNVMNLEIAEGFISLDFAKEIWDSLAEIYGEKGNIARVYQLQQDIPRMSKGEKFFRAYLSNLKVASDELQQHRPWTINLETIKKHDEEDKVFKLLAGLGSGYEHVHSSILMMQPLSSLNGTYTIIQREET